jgi:hypothetical protein
LALRDAYVEALDAYRRKDWERARAGFENVSPLSHATRRASYSSNASLGSAVTAPCAEWNGVWSLVEK